MKSQTPLNARVAFLAVAVSLVCLSSLAVLAQCGPDGCRIAPDNYQWKQSPIAGDGHRYYLYRNGRQIGGWDSRENYYRALEDGGRWGEPTLQAPLALPVELAKRPMEQGESWKTHGVDASKMQGQEHSPCYHINGRCVTPGAAFDALTLDDDSNKLWLVLIGSKESRDRVTRDLQDDPTLADLAKRVRVWSVPPDHFSLMDRDTKQPMFDVTGNPSLYLMAGNGEVLAQQNTYSGGEDLRKADPDAKKKPEPKKDDTKKDNTKKDDQARRDTFTSLAWVLSAVVVILIFTLNRKGSLHATD